MSALLLAVILTSTSADELVHLRAALEQHPEDVDVRLRLALALSRRGITKEARAHAEKIVVAAPQYWDAHLLIARLDAWEHRFDEARDRLNLVIAADPERRDAQTQLAEVDLWAGDFDRSQETLEALLQKERSPELLARLAQVEFEKQDYLSAFFLADDALELDPKEPRAIAIKDAVTLVRADVRLELENLPGEDEGHAEIVSVAAFPGNYFGFAITEEFRRRFGTNNNRVGFEGHWHPKKGFVVGGTFAFGLPAEVIAELSASIRGGVPIYGPIDVALSYSFDRFPDNVFLHRGRADVGFRIHDTLQAIVGYVFGYLRDERNMEGTLHYAEAGVHWERLPWVASASYGFGRQIDRVVFDPRAPLDSYLAHEIHIAAAFEARRWIRLGVDLGTVLRNNDTRIDTLGILARFSY